MGVSGGPKILKKFCSEGSQERVFCGGGIDIFWNYTLHSGGETQNTLKIMIFLTLVTRITHPNVNQTSGIVF